VITDATQRLVPGIFVLEDRGPQALKGVRDPVTLYRVVQPSGVRSHLAVSAGRLTPFVGCEMELATLVDRWERAADGEGQNVLILGEAGVGKSRLAYQLRERLAAVPHTWLECGASPYTEGTPFHPVIALVMQGLAFTAADATAEKVGKIERGLRDLATPEHVALLADFLGLPRPTPLALNPDVQRRKTMELLAEWNLALAAVQPLVLLVEDLHWCDASSLELLGRIIAQSATALVATARSEFTAPWPARSNLTTLPLARLTKRQAREMVTTLLGGTVPAETLEALVARADGVPLYVEELTKAVAEPGAARGADAIPSTLAGSLMARLDRLSRRRRWRSGQRCSAGSSATRCWPPSPGWTTRACARASRGWSARRSPSSAASRRRRRTPSSTRSSRRRRTSRSSSARASSSTGGWRRYSSSGSRSASRPSPRSWRGTRRRRDGSPTRSPTTNGRGSNHSDVRRTRKRSGISQERSRYSPSCLWSRLEVIGRSRFSSRSPSRSSRRAAMRIPTSSWQQSAHASSASPPAMLARWPSLWLGWQPSPTTAVM
jgi:hypothetical protein